MSLLDIARDFADELDSLDWASAGIGVYNPLRYAWSPYRKYVRTYAHRSGQVVLLGMNPGPWGMVQTGVPFGEVTLVREWLGIEGRVEVPLWLHPQRPVMGFSCTRSEVSGRRLWGWARERYGEPNRFFEKFFVLNYCPLAFFDVRGKNITPDKLPAPMRRTLEACCDRALVRTVRYLGSRIVVGVGRFAEQRASAALGETPVVVGRITHPSPANPVANTGWVSIVESELRAQGVSVP